MKRIFHDFLSLFFPNLCVVCSRKMGEGEKHICLECLSLLPKTNYHLQPGNRLEEFFAGRIPFERIAAYTYFVKGGSVQHIIHELKYKNNPDIGSFIGQLCGEGMKGSDFLSSIDYLVPVPLHPKREKKRGYNQSMEICRGISEMTGIAIDSSTLVRIVNNPSQTKHSRFDRWSNVEGIFGLSDKKIFRGKHILLVDDIITTGSTLEACAQEILKVENSKVSIFTFGTAN